MGYIEMGTFKFWDGTNIFCAVLLLRYYLTAVLHQ